MVTPRPTQEVSNSLFASFLAAKRLLTTETEDLLSLTESSDNDNGYADSTPPAMALGDGAMANALRSDEHGRTKQGISHQVHGPGSR